MLLLLIFVSSSLAVRPSPGCGAPLPSIPRPGHSHNLPIWVQDPLQGQVSRSYRVHLPPQWPLSNSLPLPLVLDYHGWTMHAAQQDLFYQVADEDPQGFLVVSPEGMGDVGEAPYGHGWGSWNISKSQGPLGSVCETDRENWDGTVCYNSCPSCDPLTSCEWTSCYDDVAYTLTLLDKIGDEYCIDLDSVHQSGISNGAMFSYIIVNKIDRFASIAPVAGAPNLGYLEVPQYPISVIDLHGTLDDTIPYSLDSPDCAGEGPLGTVTAFDGFYYYPKHTVVGSYALELECLPAVPWPTEMDGLQGFSCVIHTGCRGGGEVVHCNAAYGHDYPFGPGEHGRPERYIEAARLMWGFMKAHPKKE